MQIKKFSSREEWLGYRRGKITGSRLKDIVVKRGTEKKIGFYELVAERISTDPYGEAFDETPMERGTRLEPEALERFTTETGKKVVNELVIWTTDDNEGIASSPDGIISDTEAIETKCLSSARHIEAYLKQEVPDEYEFQVLQYFIVNDKLQTLYIAFYDPRIPGKDFFYLEVNRADKEAEIAQYLEYQKNILKEVDEVVLRLSNF